MFRSIIIFTNKWLKERNIGSVPRNSLELKHVGFTRAKVLHHRRGNGIFSLNSNFYFARFLRRFWIVDTITLRMTLRVSGRNVSRHVHVRVDRVGTHVCRRATGAYDKLITRLISIIQWAIANKTFCLLVNREFFFFLDCETTGGGACNKNNLSWFGKFNV